MSDVYETASRHIGLAVEFLRLDSETAAALQDTHSASIRDYGHGLRYEQPNGKLITDPATGEAATDPAGFLRAIERDRPNLLGKGTKTPDRNRAAPDWTAATYTELFTGIKAGNAAAQAEVERRTRAGDGTPARTAPAAPGLDPNGYTALMIAARQGDAKAREALKQRLRSPTPGQAQHDALNAFSGH